jgi:beta-aspartyl-peptidase (threonine type)
MGRWAIALHGGAGDISRNMTAERKKVTDQALHECLQIGVSALENSASALDVVEKVVSMAALNGHDGSFLFSFLFFATEPH